MWSYRQKPMQGRHAVVQQRNFGGSQNNMWRHIPTSWKLLIKVVPIFKKGSKSDMGNYRPISLLSIFSKIFEKLVYNRLYNFLEQNNILYPYQFGFRANYSTSQALISMIDKLKNLLMMGNTAVVYSLITKRHLILSIIQFFWINFNTMGLGA